MAPPAKRQKTASSSHAAASSSSSASGSTVALARRLYEACLASTEDGGDSVWTTGQLLELDVAASQKELLTLCQELMRTSLFQAVDTGHGHGAAFKLRSRAAASKYKALDDPDAVEVYRHVENAGTAGIWKAHLKKRTGIHENKIEKLLKQLCSSKHIKQLKSVRSNAKKTFMLFELEPAKEVTGGSWYSDGDLDAEFIDFIANIALHHIKAQSWKPGPRLPDVRNVPRSKSGAPTAEGDVPPKFLTKDEVEAELRMRVATNRSGKILLPHPPEYNDYPTASEVHDKIVSLDVVRDKNITLDDMKELFQRLVFDGRIECVGSRQRRQKRQRRGQSEEASSEEDDDEQDEDSDSGAVKKEEKEEDKLEAVYRWVRRPDAWSTGDEQNEFDFTQKGWTGRLGPGNGYSEVPCSRCPVFDLCDEGGPVEAKTCGYFTEWF